METLEEIAQRLAKVGMRLLKEDTEEEPPKIPPYAKNLEGTSNDGITQDNFWETKFKAGDRWIQVFPYGTLDEIKSFRAPKPSIRVEKSEWEEM